MMNKQRLTALLTLVAVIAMTPSVELAGDEVRSVDFRQTWNGYMNVSNLPADGGAFQFGSSWGTADLTAVFEGGQLVLGPNTIGDPDPYWYQGGGGPGAAGNKIMEANMYVEETDVFGAETLTFSGTFDSFTMTSAHEVRVFIKDFASDYSSFELSDQVIDSAGDFSIDLALNGGAGRHVQYGFQTIGVNVWATDVAPFGTANLAAIPEPSTMAVFGITGIALTLRRRRK